MIDLNILESEAQQHEVQQAQQSPMAKKAAQSMAKQEQISPEVQSILDEMKAMQEREAVRNRIATYAYACGGNIHAGGGSIHIDPSKRGTFTAAASRHGMGVQAFASKVLANKDHYSPAMVKKANFARNASHWHAGGGSLDKARPLYDELISANIPHNLAIGVIGNIIAESSANPEAKNSVNGGHFGYLQNDRNITNHIKKYYGGYGHAEQMQFLKDGLTGHIRGAAQAPWIQQRFDLYKQHMRGVTDPAQAALLWERDYEKSANEGLQKRADYARRFSSMLGNPSSAATDYAQYAGAGSFEPISVSPDAQSSFKPWWEQDYASAPVDDDLYAAAAGNPQLPELQDGLFGYGESDEGSYPNLFAGGGDTRYVKDTVDAIEKTFNEKAGPTPSYDNLTYSDEWADTHGYYPDARGHRDDRVKKPAHPTYPGRGQFVGNEFHFTDDGLNDVNRTLWGLIDNGDGKTVPVYNNTFVLPELTVTPNESYIQNTYDNVKYFAGGGYIEDGLRALGVTGFRVTSGYRGPNSSVGNAGKSSGHARHLHDGSSGAIDIVPLDKSAAGWAALENQLRQPQVQRFLASFGGTILDERDPATMKKTRATGPHFHIGLGVRDDGNFYGHRTTVPMGATYAGQAYDGPYYEPISVDPTEGGEDTFNPWWSRQHDNTDTDALYTAAAGNLILPEPSAETLGTSTTYPAMFADGGYLAPINVYAPGGSGQLLSDEDLVGTGWYWGSPNDAYFTDPLYKTTRNADGSYKDERYLFDENGRLVPKSVAVSYADNRTHLPAITHIFNNKDALAIDNAKKLWGNNRFYAYSSMNDAYEPAGAINRLYTLMQNSAYPKLVTNPILTQLEKEIHGSNMVMPDGRMRAHVTIPTDFTYIEPTPDHFFNDYLSELAHTYVDHNREPVFSNDTLYGIDAHTLPEDQRNTVGYQDHRYHESRAHHLVQPNIRWYLMNPSATYNLFVDRLAKQALRF